MDDKSSTQSRFLHPYIAYHRTMTYNMQMNLVMNKKSESKSLFGLGLFMAAVLTATFITVGCSLVAPFQTGQTGQVQFAIRFPDTTSQDIHQNASSRNNASSRAIDPASNEVTVLVSGVGMEATTYTFQKDQDTNDLTVNLSGIPAGSKTFVVTAGVNDGSGFEQLTTGSTTVTIGPGLNNVSVALLPIGDDLPSVFVNDDPTDSTALPDRMKFFKLVGSGGTEVDAGAYVITQDIGYISEADAGSVFVYDATGRKVSVISETENNDGSIYRHYYISLLESNEQLYVGVYNAVLGGGQVETYSVNFYNGLHVSAEPDKESVIEDTTPVVLTFNHPVNFSAANLLSDPQVSYLLNRSDAPPVVTVSTDKKTVTLTPPAEGWNLGSNKAIYTDGENPLTDEFGNTYSLTGNLYFQSGRIVYVDPQHANAYEGASPPADAGRKTRPYKYLDEVFSADPESLFGAEWNYYGAVRVANRGTVSVIKAGNSLVIDDGASSYLHQVNVEGGYDPVTWERDLSEPSLIEYNPTTDEGLPAVHVSSVHNVELSGFVVKKQNADSAVTQNLVQIDNSADTIISDNVLVQIPLTDPSEVGESNTLAIVNTDTGITPNYYVFRNSFVGSETTHQITQDYNSATVNISAISYNVTQLTEILIADNTIETGDFDVSGVNSFPYVSLNGIVNASDTGTGKALVAGNTFLVGTVTGLATIDNRSAFESKASSSTDYILNNLFIGKPGSESSNGTAAVFYSYDGSVTPSELRHNIFSDWDSAEFVFVNYGVEGSLPFADIDTFINASGNIDATYYASQTLANRDSDYYPVGGVYRTGGLKPTSMTSTQRSKGFDIGSGSDKQADFTSNGIFYYVLDSLGKDRTGTARTGNGSTGWTPGAYEVN